MNESANSDRDSFVRLIVRHDRAIRAYLRSLLPTANDVDEVMQETSVVAWRKFDQLDDPENFCRWVCVIARYEVLMHRRKMARDRFVLSDSVEQLIADEGMEELSLRDAQLDALESCLAKLPARRRQLVMRVYASQEPMKSIARQIGKSPEALYQFVSRTRRDLLDCVTRQLTESES